MNPFYKKVYFTEEEVKRLREAKRKVAAYEDAYEEARGIVWELQKAEAERHAQGESDFQAEQKAREYYAKFNHLENKLRQARKELKAIEVGELTDDEVDEIISNFH